MYTSKLWGLRCLLPSDTVLVHWCFVRKSSPLGWVLWVPPIQLPQAPQATNHPLGLHPCAVLPPLRSRPPTASPRIFAPSGNDSHPLLILHLGSSSDAIPAHDPNLESPSEHWPSTKHMHHHFASVESVHEPRASRRRKDDLQCELGVVPDPIWRWTLRQRTGNRHTTEQ